MHLSPNDLPGLRQLKAARHVADCGSLTHAAELLNRSQSAITKALNQLEAHVGKRLFDRTAHGVIPTAAGNLLVERVRQVEAEFASAGAAWAQLRDTPRRHNPIFSMDISHRRLSALVAVFELGDVSRAASQLRVTRASINASVRELESLLEAPLFEAHRPTVLCETLVGHIKLAFSLIRHGLDDIASLEGEIRGRVVVGTLPYSRTLLAPRTIHRVLESHPLVQISTQEGPYGLLESSLRNGDLDLIIGATRDLENSATLATETLFEDKLAVVARGGHPLTGKQELELLDLMEFGWVLPARSTPARRLFDRYLAERGLPLPAQTVETSSLSTVRGLLLESDRVALLSGRQVYYDERAGLLQTLPIDLHDTYRPIGITLRRHTTPSPAARVLIAQLHECAEETSDLVSASY
ncbi:LysR family transcriptional regulator [Microbulbifer hainanensis]|uniref:LysR family transcriptional regulator n=1 Tax=Microbulbifer hainanensis TaxID=2735675 RepID=UPI001D013ABE|nr:LysR family transcriptional regulator [Microbulbifer hainanensis]